MMMSSMSMAPLRQGEFEALLASLASHEQTMTELSRDIGAVLQRLLAISDAIQAEFCSSSVTQETEPAGVCLPPRSCALLSPFKRNGFLAIR